MLSADVNYCARLNSLWGWAWLDVMSLKCTLFSFNVPPSGEFESTVQDLE